ncbi:MAG: HzsA-related protein [Thermoguttaceae bacterium]
MKASSGIVARRIGACLGVALLGLILPVSAAEPQRPQTAFLPVVITPAELEADWVLQDRVRKLPAVTEEVRRAAWASITAPADAAGGCDGVKDGTYGFHTNRDQEPWWQVDLGAVVPLARVVVYNRCDGNVSNRAARLKLLLSDDGSRWKACYEHDGRDFLGQSDGRPLVIPTAGNAARFVRIHIPGPQYFHLDEVEVFAGPEEKNLALGRPADQSSASPWSNGPVVQIAADVPIAAPDYPTHEVVERGLQLAASLSALGVQTDWAAASLGEADLAASRLAPDAPPEQRRDSYLAARQIVRQMSLTNPLLDFDDLLFVKRVPGSFTHMSDQYYGWWSRPGGGIFLLEDFKTEARRLRCLTPGFEPGSFLRPDLSADGRRVLFAYCKHYPGLDDEPNKLDKANVPEDAFYHLFEMNLDGTGLRRLTSGRYDDFDGRYLPGGQIAFLSTRRGHDVQCGQADPPAASRDSLPDCYVRCGGGPERPVAVYTLHVMNLDGKQVRQISPFEMFEWTPSVDRAGRILYARWDYVDRYNMPYMSLWSTLPDGTNQQAVYGNMTVNPHCIFEARCVPDSPKIVFTASGHHALTGGSLVLLDPRRGNDGQEPLERLTPEVAFPESEGWPHSYFANPYPLSEDHYLVAWSGTALPPGTPRPQWGMPGAANDLGIYLFDAFGNLQLVYRDPEISSETPLPVRSQPLAPQVSSSVDPSGRQVGTVLLQDVYRGLDASPRGSIRRLRLVGLPVKTHPTMNYPSIGLTRDDPGKFVLGTVPVEEDGSANFLVPSGVPFFLQALDEHGVAVQTMRSATSVQPGQTFACIGCHEPRNSSPVNRFPLAARREPSRIAPGPEGSWPLDFQTLVGPVLEKSCVSCHGPGKEGSQFDLTPQNSYDSLVAFGKPSLRDHVMACYAEGRSHAGAGAAQTSQLVHLLRQGHYQVQLSPTDWERLFTWIDTYAQRLGSFDADQEQRLRDLKQRMAAILAGS